MIQVKKDLDSVPKSLNNSTTKKRRDEVLAAGCYPTSKNIQSNTTFTANVKTYDSRYKCEDVKEKLETLYDRKCVYCEQRIEGYHIEHYRPKSIYYWLAYSWDNLLYCCSLCNSFKLNFFKVLKRVSISDFDITDIHKLRDIYDEYEQPQLVNPEKEDVCNDLIYDKKGFVKSENERLQYTIDTCRLDRKPLHEWRQRIYDDFEEEIIIYMGIIGSKNASPEAKEKAKIELELHITKFAKTMNNPKSDFTSFRKYIFKNWLKDLYKLQ